VLWRLHRMHHADLDIDVTTGVRFHPFEILISLAIKIATVMLFGIPAIAVLLFEVVLNATSMFNHANVSMPAVLDRVLRLLVVTPDMHRVHHSILRNETDSNFGFNLPWWDRLFGTYRAAPAAGHHGMTIGLPIFRNPRELRVDRLLTQPFRDDTVAADDESGPGGKRGDPRDSPGPGTAGGASGAIRGTRRDGDASAEPHDAHAEAPARIDTRLGECLAAAM